MWQFFMVIGLKLVRYGIIVLLKGFWLALKLIKGEFYLIRESFRNYPIGFFSFFIHFFGFWISLGMALVNRSFLFKIYTLGLCKVPDDYSKIVGFPFKMLEILMELPYKTEDIMGQTILMMLVVFGVLWIAPTVFVIIIESLFVLFPVIWAIITQIVLGIPFQSFVLRWREKRMEKIEKRLYRQVYEEPRVETSTQQQYYIQDEGNGVNSIEVQRNIQRPILREFNPTYSNVLERVGMLSIEYYKVYEQLNARFGKNASVTRVYEDMVAENNDLQCIYVAAYDTILYSHDEELVKQSYEALKKGVMRTKNAQADFVEQVKKVYGVGIKN